MSAAVTPDLERAARALARSRVDWMILHGLWNHSLSLEEAVDHQWKFFVEEVRAVLLAIREPSEAMDVAARDWSAAKYGRPVGSEGSRGCWLSQIDAILGEKP